MKTAILLGLSISEFHEITPYELMLYSEAVTESRHAEMEEKLTLVWLGEYYHRTKRLPRLKDELKKITGEKQMTDDEMLQAVKALNAQFGGTVEKNTDIGNVEE